MAAKKKRKNGERLMEWYQKHKHDKSYRAAIAEGARRHMRQLYRDAELGRMTREVLNGLGDTLLRLADASRVLRAMMAAGKEAERSSTINS